MWFNTLTQPPCHFLGRERYYRYDFSHTLYLSGLHTSASMNNCLEGVDICFVTVSQTIHAITFGFYGICLVVLYLFSLFTSVLPGF